MLPKCCLNFIVDPRDAMDSSVYDLNRNHNTIFRGVLKPPVGYYNFRFQYPRQNYHQYATFYAYFSRMQNFFISNVESFFFKQLFFFRKKVVLIEERRGKREHVRTQQSATVGFIISWVETLRRQNYPIFRSYSVLVVINLISMTC